MGRTLLAGPSVGHPFLCETTTLRAVPVANSSEWTRTWSSCVAHSSKVAFIVPGGLPSIQSLPVWMNSSDIFDGLHTAGERVKYSWTVREERGGPGITVKRKKIIKNIFRRYCIGAIQFLGVAIWINTSWTSVGMDRYQFGHVVNRYEVYNVSNYNVCNKFNMSI